MTEPQRRSPLVGWLIRLVGPALLAIVLLRMKDPGGVWRAIASAHLGWLLFAVALNLVNIHLKVVRWDVILRTRGFNYPMRKAWPAFLSSLYLGIVTPGRVGDVLRVQYLQHDLGTSRAEGLASVVVDRLCDLYVLAGFVAVGMVRYAPALSPNLVYFTWASVAGVVLGPLVFLIPGVADKVMRAIFTRLARKSPGLEGSSDVFLAALRASVGWALLKTIPLTVLTFVVNYAQGWLIARSMGLPMSLYDATCLLAVASLLGLLPISISGAGVREVFFQQVFPLMGPLFTPEAGVGFGLLVFFVIYLVIAGIGFVSWQIAPPPSGGARAPA